MLLDHTLLFATYDRIQAEKAQKTQLRDAPRNALQAFLHNSTQAKSGSGFQRMQRCRYGWVSRGKWFRVYH
jgi:hypothetical protein